MSIDGSFVRIYITEKNQRDVEDLRKKLRLDTKADALKLLIDFGKIPLDALIEGDTVILKKGDKTYKLHLDLDKIPQKK